MFGHRIPIRIRNGILCPNISYSYKIQSLRCYTQHPCIYRQENIGNILLPIHFEQKNWIKGYIWPQVTHSTLETTSQIPFLLSQPKKSLPQHFKSLSCYISINCPNKLCYNILFKDKWRSIRWKFNLEVFLLYQKLKK